MSWRTIAKRLRALARGRGRAQQTIADQLPVLPILERHLQETVGQIERDISRTCMAFEGMATRAQDSVARAQRTLGDGASADTSLGSLVETAKRTLEHLLERSERSAELSRQAFSRMEETERVMAKIAETTKHVDSIAFGIRILALNAKIEAVHVGQQGAGFGVVADEITRHAEESAKIADDIRAVVAEQMKEIGATRDTLGELAQTTMHSVSVGQQEVQRALTVLSDTNTEMQASTTEAARTCAALVGDINSAIVALQFQDRVSQRIAHVVAALEDIRQEFDAALGSAPRANNPHNTTLARLQARYTMAEEHHAQLAPTGTDGATASSGAVELF